MLQIYRKHRKRLWAGWLTGAVFSVLAFMDVDFIAGVEHYRWGNYTYYGWIGIPFLLFIAVFSFILLRTYWIEYRNSADNSIRKLRIRNLMIAFCIAYIGALDFVGRGPSKFL
jgi:uncharacterized membrane-anchored protein